MFDLTWWKLFYDLKSISFRAIKELILMIGYKQNDKPTSTWLIETCCIFLWRILFEKLRKISLQWKQVWNFIGVCHMPMLNWEFPNEKWKDYKLSLQLIQWSLNELIDTSCTFLWWIPPEKIRKISLQRKQIWNFIFLTVPLDSSFSGMLITHLC